MENSENIVLEWLRSLSLCHYGPSFIDNGYDDLEICKKIGEQDLDAVGVLNVCERIRILDAVNSLKVNGGTAVYLAIEEYMKRNKSESPAGSEKIKQSRPNSMSSEEKYPSGSNKDLNIENTCDTTRIALAKLQRLIKDKLRQDGIKLFNPPYSSATGDRGYLEGLASHYADDLKTFYNDVLNVLEEIRIEEWKNMSPRMMLHDGINSVPILPVNGVTSAMVHNSQTSLLDAPQTIYAPGKYSPSSCLSHCEEDVIYGFGGEQTGSSACVFPGEKFSMTPKKKPGGISKLLRTLRVRREKSPRHVCQSHSRQGRKNTPQNCKTMALIYPRPALLTTDPKTQRRRVLQMARDGELSLEEAMAWLRISRIEESCTSGIYCNTKDQTARYYKYSTRSHSQSPAHGFHGNSLNPSQSCCCQTPGFSSQACEAVVHWYDEPSYENQGEYFLRRKCFKNNESCEGISPCCTQESDVISLPSAGDIALGRHGQVFTRESPIGSSGRISSEELLCSNELSVFPEKEKCCNMKWNKACWDTGDYIRQRSSRDSGDYAGSDSRSLSISSLEESAPSLVIGRCRALIDIPSNPQDLTTLSFKKGDIIDILSTRPDGLWVGKTSQGTGTLLPNTVELLNVVSRNGIVSSSSCSSSQCIPLTGGTFPAIKNILRTFGCEEYLALLISNGYDDLECLRNLELSDLDLLGIRDPQSRANLLAAVRYLHQTLEPVNRPTFAEQRQSIRSNLSAPFSPNYREPKDTVQPTARAKRPTFLQQYNIPISQRCCSQDYVNGELCSSGGNDTSTLFGRLQLTEASSRDAPREEERDTFGDFGKRYGSEKSSDSGISVRSRSPAILSPGQKDGLLSSKRFVKQTSHQNLMN
ncbi:uncharacterized protein LOC136037956 [Artemia franciscana]|uniref:Shal K[+] channel interacting protein n=1 Tax=Artemia franciscana TaxID=6661 RepID=A0AA88LBW1_ARTSF|nr:hypothetical protein QYM36_010312 [Artemia franciscana]